MLPDSYYLSPGETVKNITNIKYIQTPFGGHRILSFIKKGQNEKGKGYYKMNTSILKDTKYREIVEETINELEELCIENEIEKWEIFLLTIKSKSISYSQTKNRIKTRMKNTIVKQIFEMEENPLKLKENGNLAQYNYLKQKIKEIEEIEIEGYLRRIKYLPTYEKNEPDIAFYSKLEEKKIAKEVIGQLAESKEGKIYTDNKNITKIATNFYTDLYTPNKVNTRTQDRLLRNIKKKFTQEQRDKLNTPILEDEVKTALFQMQIPDEFYKL